MNVTELRPGNYFVDDNILYEVLDILLNKNAMRKMIAKVKVRNVRTGSITELSRNSGYDVDLKSVDKRNMQYLYDGGTGTLTFMDPETYDQIEIAKTLIGDDIKFLVPNLEVNVVSFEDEVLGINLPAKVTMEVTECEPGVKGDTKTNTAMKDAVLETGMRIRVPLFVEQGDKIIVNTVDGKYDKRA